MKLLLPGLLAIFFCSIFSCTKTNNVTTTAYDTTTVVVRDTVYYTPHSNPIVGLWVGTYTVFGDAVESFYYSFNIDSNGMMITIAIGANNTSSSSAGPWQLSGTAFTSSLTTLDGGSPVYVQACTAVYDSTAGTLAGQVVPTQGSGLSGNFLLLRVQ
jgi:hypothetical protein